MAKYFKLKQMQIMFITIETGIYRLVCRELQVFEFKFRIIFYCNLKHFIILTL